MADQRTRSEAEQAALERIEQDARDVGEVKSAMDLQLLRRGWDEAMYWVESQSAS